MMILSHRIGVDTTFFVVERILLDPEKTLEYFHLVWRVHSGERIAKNQSSLESDSCILVLRVPRMLPCVGCRKNLGDLPSATRQSSSVSFSCENVHSKQFQGMAAVAAANDRKYVEANGDDAASRVGAAFLFR